MASPHDLGFLTALSIVPLGSGTSYMMTHGSDSEYPSQRGRNFKAFYDMALGVT